MPETTSSADQPRTREKDDQFPLYIKMYFRQAFIDLVRMLGYEGLPVSEAQERIQPLIEQHGKAVMEEAADELVEYDDARDPPIVRLTAHARALAVQLLGRPKEPKPADALAEETTAGDNTADGAVADEPSEQPTSTVNDSSVPHTEPESTSPPAAGKVALKPRERQAKLRRSEALKAFRNYLKEDGIAHVVFDKERQNSLLTEEKIKNAPDFIVYVDPKNRLVTVRPYLRAMQRLDLVRWASRFGEDYEAVRVWPVETDNGPDWRWHPLEPETVDPDDI